MPPQIYKELEILPMALEQLYPAEQLLGVYKWEQDSERGPGLSPSYKAYHQRLQVTCSIVQTVHQQKLLSLLERLPVILLMQLEASSNDEIVGGSIGVLKCNTADAELKVRESNELLDEINKILVVARNNFQVGSSDMKVRLPGEKVAEMKIKYQTLLSQIRGKMGNMPDFSAFGG